MGDKPVSSQRQIAQRVVWHIAPQAPGEVRTKTKRFHILKIHKSVTNARKVLYSGRLGEPDLTKDH